MFQLVLQQSRLYGIESTGEIKEHDPHCAPSLLQLRKSSVLKVDNTVIYSDVGLVGKLQRVHCWFHHRAEISQDQFLQGLHQV